MLIVSSIKEIIQFTLTMELWDVGKDLSGPILVGDKMNLRLRPIR